MHVLHQILTLNILCKFPECALTGRLMVMSLKDVASSNLRFAYCRWTRKNSQSCGQVVDRQKKQIAASLANYLNVALGYCHLTHAGE